MRHLLRRTVLVFVACNLAMCPADCSDNYMPGTRGGHCRALPAEPCDPGLICRGIDYGGDPICIVADAGLHKPDAAKDGISPDGIQPDRSPPDSSKPDVSKPDALKSDASKPDAPRPDVAKPDLITPDAKQPDLPKPDTCGGKVCLGVCVDTTTDPANCGGCGKPCSSTQQCTGGTCTVGCLASTAGMQVFSAGMYGCAGSVAWANRSTLCTAGYHVCSGAEWVAKRGAVVPAYSYWTSENLNFVGGTVGGCFASLSAGTPCSAGGPMHVCMGATDPKGNTCSTFGCGYNSPTPNQYFGGCNAQTAGALCCR